MCIDLVILGTTAQGMVEVIPAKEFVTFGPLKPKESKHDKKEI
jgi:hypothetical protein